MDVSLNLEGRHPFCFRLDSAVIVIVNILGNHLGEGLKGGIILFKSIAHFIFQSAEEGFHKGETTMEFFNSAIEVLQTLVVALGAGLGVWGTVNLLEGYGGDNPSAKSQGMKQFMAN